MVDSGNRTRIYGATGRHSAVELCPAVFRVAGVEPATSAPKAEILPIKLYLQNKTTKLFYLSEWLFPRTF